MSAVDPCCILPRSKVDATGFQTSQDLVETTADLAHFKGMPAHGDTACQRMHFTFVVDFSCTAPRLRMLSPRNFMQLSQASVGSSQDLAAPKQLAWSVLARERQGLSKFQLIANGKSCFHAERGTLEAVRGGSATALECGRDLLSQVPVTIIARLPIR